MPLPLIPVAITAVSAGAAYFFGSQSGEEKGRAFEAKKQTIVQSTNITLILGSVVVSGALLYIHFKRGK